MSKDIKKAKEPIEQELDRIVSECAEKTFKKIIKERMDNTRTETLELGLDVKILPPPSGECGIANRCDKTGLFPYDKFQIFVWGESDHEPVFHVVGFNWDVAFYYETGELYGVVSAGSNIKVFNYMRNKIPIWLKQQSTLYNKMPNCDVIHAGWSCYN